MTILSQSTVRLGILLLAASAAGVAAPGAAAPRDAAEQRLVLAVSSPYLLAPARIGAQYGIVTSGFRSALHNRRVGGMPNSYHLLGRAIDVQRRPGVTHAMVDAAFRRAGFNLIESLDEIDHSHFAFGDVAKVRYAPSTSTIAVKAPTVPAKPAEPALLADMHGVLVIDDQRTPGSGGIAGVP
jgi:hypothetical protein